MRVLVAVDGSDIAETAFDRTLELFPNAHVTALYVMSPVDGATVWSPETVDWLARAEEHADELLRGIRRRADRPIETEATVGQPARSIIEYAEEGDFDHIVVGSHGRDGVKRMVIGSVAETVVRRAPIPVTVIRE